MPPRSLKVATFNIHHAEGRDGVVDLHRTADLITRLDVDLIGLQELDERAHRSGEIDQPNELAELLGMQVHFAPTLPLDHGRYGIALAGRVPFRATVQDLPRLADEEPRVVIVASCEGIAVVTTHLSRSAAARRSQTEALAGLVRRLGAPALVIGDLNQKVRDLGPLTSAGLTAVKGSSGLRGKLVGGFQIDHILHTQDITVKGARTVTTDVSDHHALVAEILVHA